MQLLFSGAGRKPELQRQSRSEPPPSLPLTAELDSSYQCNCEPYGHGPVLSLCRELLHAGCNPGQAIEISRAGVLALCVRSIARAARLAIEDSEHGRLQFQLARQNEKNGDGARCRDRGLCRAIQELPEIFAAGKNGSRHPA
jgi:hypothetical protein